MIDFRTALAAHSVSTITAIDAGAAVVDSENLKESSSADE